MARRRSGGIGRRAGLKIQWGFAPCGFDPRLRHCKGEARAAAAHARAPGREVEAARQRRGRKGEARAAAAHARAPGREVEAARQRRGRKGEARAAAAHARAPGREVEAARQRRGLKGEARAIIEARSNSEHAPRRGLRRRTVPARDRRAEALAQRCHRHRRRGDRGRRRGQLREVGRDRGARGRSA